MRTETSTITVELYSESINSDGMTEYTPTGEHEDAIIIDIYADNGKIVRRIGDTIGCLHITLGTQDSLSNYEEVTA